MVAGSRASGLIAEARSVLDPLISRLARRPSVAGIAVLSSMAATGERVTFDELSDIDLVVWVAAGMRPNEWRPDPRATRRLLADRLPTWLGNFSFHVPLRWGMVEVNLHQRILEYDADERTVWDDAMREAHAHTAQVVYDPEGAIGRLINSKTRMGEAEQLDRLVRLAARLHWDIRRAPERMVRRGDIAAGHHILTAATDEIIEALYALHGRFVPHRKWRLAGLARHGLATKAEAELLNSAIRVADLSEAEFHCRVTALEALWRRIRTRLPKNIPADVYSLYNATVSANRQLRARTVADEVADRYAERFGPEVYDLTNYLVPSGLDELASLDGHDIDALPGRWKQLAVSLRDHIRRDLSDSPAKVKATVDVGAA